MKKIRIKTIIMDRASDNYRLDAEINHWMREAESGAITEIKAQDFKILNITVTYSPQGNAMAVIQYEGSQK